MNRFNAAALCLMLAAGCGAEESAGTDSKAPAKEVIFISASVLIPGDGPPVENGIMVIENGVITQVGKKDEFYAPRGAARAELEGMTIAPLLVNLHAYPGLGSLEGFGAKNYSRDSLSADLNRYGYYGIGAVLAGGDSDGLAMQVRDEIKEGKATGARLYSSGRGIAAKGVPGHHMGDIPILVTGEAEARKAVGELADRNADAIVVWAEGMKADASDAIVDEAHKRKLKVFAHAPGLAEAKNLVKAGVDGLITSIRDREVDDELVSMMKEKKIPLSPGLTALESKFVYGEKVPWLSEQSMREVYPASVSAYLSNPVVIRRFRHPRIGALKEEFTIASKNLKKLADAGVPITLGSGSGLADTFPGYFEHRELELMVNAGMSPLAVLTAATSASAAVLGANDLGVLAPGKKGSFLVFASNPLDKISNSRDIDRVYVNGSQLDRGGIARRYGVKPPKVSEADQKNEKELQDRENIAIQESKMQKYGPFPLGAPLNVAPGLIVQTPRLGKASSSAGPPYKVTVQRIYATGAELQDFYSKYLAAAGWKAAGGCWEKANLTQTGKSWRICTDPGGSNIVLNISVQ